MQHIPANTPFFHGAWLEIFHQNIRFRTHALEQFCPFGLAQIQRGRFLVPAFRKPGQRIAIGCDGAEFTQGVAHHWQFKLDYLSAEFRQLRGGEGAGDKGGNVNDAHPFQR
jgi:hypothetical protein